MILRTAIVLIFCCLLTGCKWQSNAYSQPISFADVKEYLNTSAAIPPATINADCVETIDTLYSNLPYTYKQGLAVLHSCFNKIDSSQLGASSKQYCKLLLLADFTYATFSYQFLGPALGLEKDTNCNWHTIPLADFYELGNKNQFSFYCTERSIFFLRMADTLLHIKGRIISVEGVHDYPIVYLHTDTFIVDPFDPFVICDSARTNLLNYNTALNSKLSNSCIPVRTRRFFGNTRQLISGQFADNINADCNHKNNSCFCVALARYILHNRNNLEAYVKPCFELPDKPLYNTLKVIGAKGQNRYAMEMHGRVDGQLTNYADIRRYYVGFRCDSL